jgi:phosphatidate cytidylyltransferase
MHLKRIIVALISIPLLYLLITKASPVYFLGLLVVGALLAQYEFYAMYRARLSLAVLGMAAGTALLILSATTGASENSGLALSGSLIIGIMLLLMTARLFVVRDPSGSLRDLAPVITGIFYIPLLLLPLWQLRLAGPEWIMLLLGAVWGADTAAYYIGSGIGRMKLYPSVSPKKTVEGAIGSVAGGLGGALIVGAAFMDQPAYGSLAFSGAVLGAVTIVGDLVESMFKRDAGIKDSGTIIPGHGGVLDRIDSILFAGPALYFLRMLG